MSKKYSILFTVVILSIMVSSAAGKIWVVDANPGNPAKDFSTLQAAHDGAADGDTIYVFGAGQNYGSCSFSKTLYVFGPGYFLTENPNTQANPASAQVSTLIFNAGSENSLITGIQTTSYIYMGVSNITIKRNFINYYLQTGTNVSNIIITQNYIYYNAATQMINIGSNNSNILISNNLIETTTTSPSYYAIYSQNSTSSIEVVNNVIRWQVLINGASIFDNNILREGAFTAPLTTPRNNLANSIQFGTANGNQENVDMNTVFVGTGSTDGQWQLTAGSPALGAGVNGENCGMYGSVSPYVLSGIPAIPTIYYFSSPTTGSNTQGLNVNIKVKSRN